MCLHFGGIFDDIIGRIHSQREVFLSDSILLHLHGTTSAYDGPIFTPLEQGRNDSVHQRPANISMHIRDLGDWSSDTFQVIFGSRHRYPLFSVLDRLPECG